MKIQLLSTISITQLILLFSFSQTRITTLKNTNQLGDNNPYTTMSCNKSLFEGLIGVRYIVNSFDIQTEDGYILQVFRLQLYPQWLWLQSEKLQKNINRPVLLQHGQADSSDSWFLNKKDGSIGFYLLEQGFDLWIGNNRGNKYSKRHVNETISDSDFFNYSFDEMALYDLPAVYNKIVSQYHDKPDTKIIYIGHSQGTSQMFAGLTNPLRDDVKTLLRDKTEIFIAVEPITYLTEVSSQLLKQGIVIEDAAAQFAKSLNINEVATAKCVKNDSWLKILQYTCSVFNFMCDGYDVVNGFDSKVDNINEVLETFDQHNPSGTSARTFLHFGQLIKGKDYKWFQNRIPMFRMYDYAQDYGYEKNQAVYGSDTPPDYNLQEFETNLAIIVGTNDGLASPQNTENLIEKLPTDKANFIDVHKIEGWGHNTLQVPKEPRKMFDILDKYL